MALRHTLLPLPVAPAMRRWGIFARSATTGTPETPLPREIASFDFALMSWYSELSMTFRRVTTVAVSFGTSMPTMARPGTGASMRRLGAARARARSLWRAVILLTRTRVRPVSTRSFVGRPFASRTGLLSASLTGTSLYLISQPGSTPNWVTAGPSLISTTEASTPKLASVSTMSWARAALSCLWFRLGLGSCRSSMGGSCQPLLSSKASWWGSSSSTGSGMSSGSSSYESTGSGSARGSVSSSN